MKAEDGLRGQQLPIPEIEELPGEEERPEIERRRPGELGDGIQRHELDKLEQVRHHCHDPAGVAATPAQIDPPLRLIPQEIVKRKWRYHPNAGQDPHFPRFRKYLRTLGGESTAADSLLRSRLRGELFIRHILNSWVLAQNIGPDI